MELCVVLRFFSGLVYQMWLFRVSYFQGSYVFRRPDEYGMMLLGLICIAQHQILKGVCAKNYSLVVYVGYKS